jgi:outer membrane protein OmpA-like peptidoglycan-associated protein/tetratricopeptide (TPR) repeat protein
MIAAFRKIVIFSVLILNFHSLSSQILSKKEFIKTVQEADVFYYYNDDYETASHLYEKLFNVYPDNCNLSAKLGICYLNIEGKKADALRLLEKAKGNVVANDNEYIEYGEKAPLDTYLYLAIAYHQNDSLNKAISLFYEAKRKLGKTEVFREDYIDNQIRACRYSIEMQKKPLPVVATLFTPWLDKYPGASNPVISKNDSVFVFTQQENDTTRILCSYKSGVWKLPSDITAQLGSKNKIYSNSITGDGKLLIIYMDENGDGNLYFSQRKDSVWTRLKSLGKNINTIYWEAHGYITPDGKTLIFASNRPGGEGELDLWISEKDNNGLWKKPLNCGKIINTPYNENTPFYDPETNEMLFSSAGHPGMGGYDIFRTKNINGNWSHPIGLPYALNNTTDNTFFIPNGNSAGFISSFFDVKTGALNIYSIVKEDLANKNILVKGYISLQDGMPVNPSLINIQLYDQKSGAPLKNIPLAEKSSFKFEIKPGDFRILVSHIGYKTDTINLNMRNDTLASNKLMRDTAFFNFEVKPGDYMLLTSHTGYKTDTFNLNITVNSTGNYLPVNAALIPDKVFSGEFLSVKNILFEFDKSELTDKAISTLEVIKSVLVNNPELKIEIAGYTDEKGSNWYNMYLSDKRAQTAINYLSASGISASRLIKKAFGKTNFISINTNPDGTDNPEGRKYNRRVTFGIIDPHTGVVIRQETYTPEHLRQPSSIKYYIVLAKSEKNLATSYFKELEMEELQFMKSVKLDSISIYTLGEFYNKADALKYLVYAQEKGFKDAYIVTQYEINNTSKTLMEPELKSRKISVTGYTIQLKSSKQQLSMNMFKDVAGVKEIASSDGYYRYIYGDYKSYIKAKEELTKIHESGFKDAFIRDSGPLLNNR